jgi:serine protease AprX
MGNKGLREFEPCGLSWNNVVLINSRVFSGCMETLRDQIRQNLGQTAIGRPLIDHLERSLNSGDLFDVIIDPHLAFPGGRQQACERILELLRNARIRHDSSHPYLFARLTAGAIRDLVARDSAAPACAIYRIWEDAEIRPCLTSSIATVKADAAQTAFAAEGRDIVWAVADSGIDASHPHFGRYANLILPAPLSHADFTGCGNGPLSDEFGHGTHVAGIIAGVAGASEGMRGMAPQCSLLSLKVLNGDGIGKTSAVIEAIAAVHKMNDFGRRIAVHGLNLSLGYPFLAEWFACGQSPLCTEVNRLVKSGVVVVVAAGNSGYGSIGAMSGALSDTGLALTINDPGNAELAITVGSTHREMPHTYGVSYFSSKGPTGDGRLKPDLVAPGERIVSCAAGRAKLGSNCLYVEDSGTSMAAPHVSGAIAAFLSIRREYIGQPEEVKKIFMDNATDLKRERTFQGRGLLDLMRAIQAV